MKPKLTSDWTVVDTKRYQELLVTERNYGVVMDLIDSLPSDLDDMIPDWDWKKGEPIGEEDKRSD